MSSLCPKQDILSKNSDHFTYFLSLLYRYHPLQDLLSEEELLEGLNLEFINRVCEVGVDINECVAHGHMQNLVQFVAGLGPRKG